MQCLVQNKNRGKTSSYLSGPEPQQENAPEAGRGGPREPVAAGGRSSLTDAERGPGRRRVDARGGPGSFGLRGGKSPRPGLGRGGAAWEWGCAGASGPSGASGTSARGAGDCPVNGLGPRGRRALPAPRSYTCLLNPPPPPPPRPTLTLMANLTPTPTPRAAPPPPAPPPPRHRVSELSGASCPLATPARTCSFHPGVRGPCRKSGGPRLSPLHGGLRTGRDHPLAACSLALSRPPAPVTPG